MRVEPSTTLDRVSLLFDEVMLSVVVDRTPGHGVRPDLWPSVGEHPCYDAFLYSSMTHDGVRNSEFARAVARVAPGRAVLDIGTGQDLTWALVAARAGARRVVAVEAIPQAYEAARRLVTGRPEARAVELLHGYSTELSPRIRAEVCVAEVIGSVASAEGVLAVIADARRRLLTEDAVVIPHRCTTKVGAVCLREMFPGGLAFAADSVT
jgi:type I protein arginine methyltransferase